MAWNRNKMLASQSLNVKKKCQMFQLTIRCRLLSQQCFNISSVPVQNKDVFSRFRKFYNKNFKIDLNITKDFSQLNYEEFKVIKS